MVVSDHVVSVDMSVDVRPECWGGTGYIYILKSQLIGTHLGSSYR